MSAPLCPHLSVRRVPSPGVWGLQPLEARPRGTGSLLPMASMAGPFLRVSGMWLAALPVFPNSQGAGSPGLREETLAAGEHRAVCAVPEPDLLMPRAGSRRRGEPVTLERHAHEHKPWGFTGLTVGSPKPRLSCDEAIPDFQETMNEGFMQRTGRDVVTAMLPETSRVRTGSLKPVLLREYVSASVQLCLEMHVSDEKSQCWKECVHVGITKDLLCARQCCGFCQGPRAEASAPGDWDTPGREVILSPAAVAGEGLC